MKEAVKKIIAGRLIQLEKMLGDIEQDSWNSGLSDRERKGLIVERDEVRLAYVEAKECFHWVNDLEDKEVKDVV